MSHTHSAMRATHITAATPPTIAIIILSSSSFMPLFLSLLGSLLLKLPEVGSTVVASPTVDSVCDTLVVATANSVELSVSTMLVLEDVFREVGDGQLVA